MQRWISGPSLLFFGLIFWLTSPSGATDPSIAIRGTVLRAGGAGLPEAHIAVLSVPTNYAAQSALLAGHPPHSRPVAESSSDSGGRFEIEAPNAGLWRLEVSAPGFVPMFLPTLPLVDRLELPPVILRPASSAPIEVTDAAGRPLVGAGVSAATADTDVWRQSRSGAWRPAPRLGWTDANGRLELPRARGERLDFWVRRGGQLDVHSQTAVRRAQILAPRGSPISRTLRVREADGSPVPEALVSFSGRTWPIGRADEEGTLAIHGPSEAPVELLVFARDGRAHRGLLEPETASTDLTLPAAIRLAGRVVHAKGSAVAGALVWPAHDPATFVRTDRQGRYTLTVPTFDRVRLEVRAPDLLPRAQTVELESARQPATEPVDFELQPDHRLGGRVVDDAGQPIPGAKLSAVARSDRRSSPALRFDTADGRGVSGEDGRFLLRGLAPETHYRLEVEKDGYARTVQVVGPWPATSIAAERHPEMEILLPRHRLAFGRVLRLDETPAAGVEVRLSSADPSTPTVGSWPEADEATSRAITGSDGRFEISAPPAATLEISARGQGFAPMRVRGVRVPSGGEPFDLGTLVMAPGAKLIGQVSDPEGAAIAEAGIWKLDTNEPSLRRADPSPVSGPPDARTDAEGRFVLHDLEPGRALDLRVDRPGFLPQTLRDVGASDPPSISVVLRPAGQIHGRVLTEDGRPIADAEVDFQSLAASFEAASRSTITDERGEFHFADAPPGVLELSAFAPGFQPSPKRRLELAPQQQIEDLRWVLNRGAVLEGRVLNVAGEPIASAEVQVGRPADRSDVEGKFRIEGLPLGPQRVEVRHSGYNRQVRELEIERGVNSVEFQLTGGGAVAGRVVDEAQLPIAGVALELEALDPGLSDSRARSDPEGAFRFQPVADGRYRLRARHRDWVAAEPGPTVVIADETIADLEVRMRSGARIEGQILGLEFDELAAVQVRATAEGRRPRTGEVDYEGHYRISDLAADDWLVTAELSGGSRQARARVAIEPGVATVNRDLELDGGLTLSGVVLHRGEPLPATRLSIRGHDLPIRRSVESDFEGRFKIENLEPGHYRLGLSSSVERLVDNLDLWLTESRDLEIEIATAELAGRVTDAATGETLGGVLVMLKQLLSAGHEGSVFGEPSTTEGRFHFARLTAGRYRLSVQHGGYQPFETELEVPAGGAIEGFQLPLDPAAGLELLSVLASGGRPRFLNVYGRDAQGRVFTATQQTNREGATHLSSLPAGRWDLIVSGTGGAAITTHASVPGEPLTVVFPDAGRLRVRVPDLVATESFATLQVTDGAGRPFRHLGWGGLLEQAWPVAAGRAVVEGVPAGVWNLQVQGSSGRIWTGVATTTGGPDVEVSLTEATR